LIEKYVSSLGRIQHLLMDTFIYSAVSAPRLTSQDGGR